MSAKAAKRTDSKGSPRSRVSHRDWAQMLLPIFITVGISVFANVGVGIWQGATFKAQVQHIDAHQAEQDKAIAETGHALQALITRLPIDYVPRVEHEKDAVAEKELRDMQNRRLENIEGKLDLILEGQHVGRR